MNSYNIFFLDNDAYYVALIVMCNSDSPIEYLPQIEKKLLDNRICGNVLIDQILHAGNTTDRFIEAHICREGFQKKSIRFITIPKSSEYRKLSCDYLCTNRESLIDFSILTSIQKRMICKGIPI